MKQVRVNIGAIRRGQIITAAMDIISTRGIQNLSLSEIENRAGMSRGQLTYYFPTKEDILLAVFDNFLRRMQDGFMEKGKPPEGAQQGGELAFWVINRVIMGNHWEKDFYALEYTFLSQVQNRPDFKFKLSTLYEEWREKMTKSLMEGFPNALAPDDFRDLATLVQAILHGLAIQKSADNKAFKPGRLLELATTMILDFLSSRAKITEIAPRKTKARNNHIHQERGKTDVRKNSKSIS